MKYLVIGGSGFLGKRLIKYLLDQGEEVVAVSRSKINLCPSIELDISKSEDYHKLDNIKVDIIVNCASRLPEKGKNSTDSSFVEEMFMTNTVGGLNVANFAIRNNISKIINCSTLAVNDKPWPIPLTENIYNLPTGVHSAYSLSKLTQERLMNEAVANTNVQLLHLRLSALYGNEMPKQGILFYLLDKVEDNDDIKLTDAKKTSFDFLHVQDLSRIIYDLSYAETSSNTINVANGTPISLYELSEMILELKKSNNNIIDSNTTRPESHAQIDLSRLKEYLGEGYLSKMTSIKKGLSNLIKYIE